MKSKKVTLEKLAQLHKGYINAINHAKHAEVELQKAKGFYYYALEKAAAATVKKHLMEVA
jgi:hypothetical protein